MGCRVIKSISFPFFDTMPQSSISLINLNSIKDLELKSSHRISYKRFRGNIYIENLVTNTIKKITSSNNTKKLINGTFDWAYEEEFDCRDGFLFNEDGTKIAFWQIDANQVRDFLMINNTDSIYSFNIPVEYPKVGEYPSPAKIGVIDLTNENKINK